MARMLMVALAFIPAISAFAWARYLNTAHQRTLYQYSFLAVVLTCMFGVFPLQIYIDGWINGRQSPDAFATGLVVLQYLAALIAFFYALRK